MTICGVIIKIARWFKKQYSELNLFKLEIAHEEVFDLRTAIISTRIYIILLIFALIILTIFTALEGQSQTIIVRNPSQSVFINLNRQYPSTLSCPCQNITISYGSFTSMNTEYHPLCSSIFISDAWINLLNNPNISFYYPLDFRSSANGHFQLLSSLCALANRSVNDAIDDFLADTLLTQYVLSPNSFQTKVQVQSLFIQTSTNNSFRQVLQLIRSTTFSNQMQTALQTSKLQAFYQYNKTIGTSMAYETSFSDINNTICRCGSDSTCSSSLSGFFSFSAKETQGAYISYNSLIANVTGFVVGCYAIESLLQSTLECLFDISCLNGILTFFPINNSTRINHLNSSQTQFSVKTTIDTLISSLFVEKWLTVSSFDNYYTVCAPSLCSYTLNQRNSFIYILIKLLGLYGGLTIILRLIVPRVVLWWCNRNKGNARNNAHIPFTERCRILWQWMRTQISELNLFDTQAAHNDPYELTTSKITTRIFIILTCLSVFILTIYTATNVRTQTITVYNPSQKTFTDLYSKYYNTLECPCSLIAIPYDNFVSLSPQYHPVCSSLFVSSGWIDSTSRLNWPNDHFDPRDFRIAGQVFFSTLQTLCSFIQLTVSDAWYIFKQDSFITEQSISEQQIIFRTHATLDQFRFNTKAELQRALTIIQFQTMNLLTMASQNYVLKPQVLNNSTQSIEFHTQSYNWSDCSCAISDTCRYPVGFDNVTEYTDWFWSTSAYDIPQFFTGCFAIQSVLQSSLECFFNQTCLNKIQSEILSRSSINVTILRANTTIFPPETLIGDLINALMIEQWGELINFTGYYEQCAPKLCSYTITSRDSFAYVLVVILGLCGGVVVALKIIVPLVVRQVRDRCRPHVERNDATTVHPVHANRMQTISGVMKRKVSEFNLFETELSWNDAQRRRKEIITTRIHILLLVISICILTIYTSLTVDTQTITIKYPSLATFDQLRLNSRSLPTLECPCQNLSIPYQSFTSISFKFHQLCSSQFIDMNSSWINMLYSTMISQDYSYDDFRLLALPQFRLLSSLCRLANDTITDATTRFSANTLITDRTQFRLTIQSEAEAVLAQFRQSTIRTFVRTLDFTRYMAQGNGIVSATLSNWYFEALDQKNFSTIWTEPRSYVDQNNCSCSTNSTCSSPAKINGLLIPGFRIGCYALDSLLQSTLECLYNISCIESIKSVYYFFNIMINPLDPILSSPNATVQSLVNTLLVDQWETDVSYEKYYATCAPLFCSYSFNERASPIYIITAIIGFCGGLNKALKIVAPMLSKIGQLFVIHRQHRIIRRINIDINSE